MNIPAFIVLIPYPILIIACVIAYCMNMNAGWKEVSIAMIAYYGSNIAVGIGLHRLWAHSSYKAKSWFHYLLAFFSAGCLQGPALVWASDHRFHHAYADGDLDPHTPLKYKSSKLKGFFWAHIGWMLIKEDKKAQVDRLTLKTLARNKALTWQMHNYWQLAVFMNVIPPILLGFAIFGNISLHAGFAGFLFVGLGRALQQQMTFCVNSLCHFIGKKKYTNDSSYDIWWLAPLLLGENWHNFHHAFGKDYRNGHKFYHFDVHKWIIWLLSKVGIASDLVITSDERIAAKQADLIEVLWKEDVISVKNKATQLVESISERLSKIHSFIDAAVSNQQEKHQKIAEALQSTGMISKISRSMSKQELENTLKKLHAKLDKIHSKAQTLSEKAGDFVNSCNFAENITSRVVANMTKSAHKLEISARRFGVSV